ncbi:bifunctional diaminohydroxyphosphoribosylaminopyrimidine deaminase/5-amino-6-(5-phosphoribosylamino)uracil reductase RibD [Amnimonas aquatica]|uniref:Riboflavin biosynthesis protein RibD n=2 Tax=Amnimonas aquatica TaxID=2094561 RepID=A0A2P6AU91_9GAMM|nr:bifunctional diaminohydroxyphosphoribosylaminopyrimidine deaminase/5-amino-6-(5-phosphoribosylamino)uracil reductase RibD [Amnimonas aquatica]
MAEALRLAAHGRYSTHPNPRVGCVIVRDGEVVGRGFHARAGEPHAEVHALREAGERARGATAYVTLEPCAHHGRTPPCADALVAAGVARVVAACEDANPQVAGQGLARLRTAGIEVASGLLRADAVALNAGFLRRMAGGLPWVRAKVAASLDGRTAMASGESQWITGPEARRDVQRWRAASSALVTGIGTVLADDPALTVRPAQWTDPAELAPGRPVPENEDDVHQPLRVVLDGGLRLPATARLLAQPGLMLVVTVLPALAAGEALHDEALLAALVAAGDARADAATRLRAGGASLLALPPGGDGRADLRALLRLLAAGGCNEVLVEAGAGVTGAFLAAGLVDELVLYQAPTLLGSAARPLADWPLARMADQQRLAVTDLRCIGNDIRLILRPVVA